LIRVILSTFFFFIQLLLFGQSVEQTGYCTFYADKFQGHHTSGGELYDKNAFTAAHRTLPFNTLVEITNLRNNKKVIVRINDRGPVGKNRLIDVSKAAAIELDMVSYGVQKVIIKVVSGPQPLPPKDSVDKPIPIVNATTTKSDFSEKQVFDKTQKPCEPHGYGVQLGYYKNKKNCLAALASYEENYKTQGYFYVDIKSQSTFYRLILGNFPSRQQAESLKMAIMKDIPGCFVLSWNKLCTTATIPKNSKP